MVKVLTPLEAVSLIKDNDTIATSGFLMNAVAETLLCALEQRFVESGHPKNLTLIYAAGMGDGKERGLNHLGHEGLLKRVIGGHWNMVPKIGKLAIENKIEAYNLPQGVISSMYRDIAGHRVATITHVGLLTFVDPRQEGGRLNDISTEDIVELITIHGKEQLLYKTFPINACLLRATYADEHGNISMEREGVLGDALSIAQATRNSGGTVIVQVEKLVKAGTIDARKVRIPGICVDVVIVVSAPDNMQESRPEWIPHYAGEVRVPANSLPSVELDERKIVARRAAMELTPDTVVNLGIGMPEVVAMVANEEGIGEYMTLTVESGPVGGIPAGGLMFGVATNPEAILEQSDQFAFYDGGGLDLAFLGLAEADEQGNINVSKLGSRVTGAGGFINITQNSKRVVYCGTFMAKGLQIAAHDGRLLIKQEGSQKKFIKKVSHITFSGVYAQSIHQPVLYITERAVFELRADGMHLIEIAPGVDLQKDVLDLMDFLPKMETPPVLMDARIFKNELMGLK